MEIDRVGPWNVRWSPRSFSLRGTRSDVRRSVELDRIILPIELKLDPGHRTGRAIIRMDPPSWLEILEGAPQDDLLRFKRTLSGHVLDASRGDGIGCFDCAEEAGRHARQGSVSACPGCREYYCRDRGCLRRLRLVTMRDGRIRCKSCGGDYGRTFSTSIKPAPRYVNRRQPIRVEA